MERANGVKEVAEKASGGRSNGEEQARTHPKKGKKESIQK